MQPQSELPDIPALESVEQRDFNFLVLPLAYSGFLVFIVFIAVQCLLDYRQYLGSGEVSLLVLLLALFVFLLFRILSGFASFRTDSSGFYARGPLRKKFIAWSDITSASIRKTWAKDTLLTLQTRHGSFSVAPRGLSASVSASECLIASVWQHLRRLGTSDGLVLTPAMLSLWEEIPDDVPADLDWGKPPSRGVKIGALLMLTLLSAGTVYGLVAMDGPTALRAMMGSMIIGMVAVLKWIIIPEIALQAYRVHVGIDGIEADILLKRVYIPWSDVTTAGWKGRGLGIVAGRVKKEIRVPYSLGSKASEQLILAVIRYLRTAGVPQAITWPTLISKDPDALRQLGRGRIAVFLSALDPPARKRIGRLYAMQNLLVIPALSAPFCLLFTGALGKVAGRLYGAYNPGVRFFVPGSTLLLVFPFLISSAILFHCFAMWLGDRLAGRYKAEWNQLRQLQQAIGSSSRFARVRNYTLAVVGLLGVLAVPLFMNCYMKVTDRGIALNTFAEFHERSYGWDDVHDIVVDSDHVHSDSCDCGTYRVEFTDGKQWVVEQGNAANCEVEEMKKAVQFISAKSGKKIQYR